MNIYKLSPSDFAYLWEDCKYCYYLKIKYGIYLPTMPMPGVFAAINTRVQGNFVGKNLKSLAEDLPDGEVIIQEGWVESIVVPGTNVFIKGKYDLLVKNTDGTHTLVDLKISQSGKDKIEKYKTQLAAYKFALENPKQGEPHKISKLALLIFYPEKVSFEKGVVVLNFPHTWMEVPIDNNGFLEFVKKVNTLLSGSSPTESKTCPWCNYRKTLQENAWFVTYEITLGESEEREFKPTLRWDYKLNKESKEREFLILKAIASFLNSKGGKLFIGVGDKGEILGLKNDFSTLGRKNKDSFELHLFEIINSAIGKGASQYIKVKFHNIDEETICVIEVEPCKNPIFIKSLVSKNKEFYIRSGNSSKPLDIEETQGYIKNHW